MFQNIPLNEIDPNPDQPREHFTGIEELAESIKDEGLLEPIMVRPSSSLGPKRFQIVHGERRYRASKLAGLHEVPAVVREVDDKNMFRRLSVVENVQRNNLTPMEEAHSYARLQNEGYTQKQIGRIIGKGQSYVAHKLRLLKQPALLTYFLEVNQVTENHFRQVMRLKNIVGEDVKDQWRPSKEPLTEVREFRAIAIEMLLIRPMGRTTTALPMKPKSRDDERRVDTVREAVRRFDEYVAKHTPTPTWHRTAFWFLCAIVGHDWTVDETHRAIDNYEDLIQSALAWYCHKMKSMNRSKYWDEYDWAVYHDLKHAGLLDVAEGDLSRHVDALGWVSKRGGYAVPSELQGREPFWEDEVYKEIRAGDKTLEELEYGLSRSIDALWGAAVMQAEGLRIMYHSDGWKKRGYGSFGEYVEAEYGRPAETVVREDGSLRPIRELAKTLDDWGGDTSLAEILHWGARELEREEFLKLLKPLPGGDGGLDIPEELVVQSNGEPYPKPVIARKLHALVEE